MPMSIEAQQLLLLLNWMSPAFPTGQFAYSHGLEWAIETDAVTDAATLREWIGDLLTRGSGWNDAVLFARCWEDDAATLNELALALCSSQERHLETTQLGRSFRIAASVFAVRPHPPVGTFSHGFATGEGVSPLSPSPVAGLVPAWEKVAKGRMRAPSPTPSPRARLAQHSVFRNAMPSWLSCKASARR